MRRSGRMPCGGCVRVVHSCTTGDSHRVLGAQSCPPSTAGHGACPSRALEGPVTAYQAVMGGWGDGAKHAPTGAQIAACSLKSAPCAARSAHCAGTYQDREDAPIGVGRQADTQAAPRGAAQSPPSANAPSRGLAVKSRPRREPALQAGSLTGRGFVIEDHAPPVCCPEGSTMAYGHEPYARVSMA